MKNIPYLLILFLFSTSQFVQTQTKPKWVTDLKIENRSESYFGIGVSQNSPSDADSRALIAFAQNVEIKVKSIFQREVSEEGKEFSDNTNVTAELVSDISLKGISITERFADSLSKTFYSLIKYRKTEYDSLVTQEIQREILLIKARNTMIEEKKTEELRAQKAKNLQDEEQRKEELRYGQKQLELDRKEQQQEEEKRILYKKLYAEFLIVSPPEKMIVTRNGEIAHQTSVFLIKGGIAPFRFNGGYYSVRLAMFEFSVNAVFHDGKFNQQEGFARIQILPAVGELSKTSIAVGMSQAVGMIADSSYHFKRSKYSFLVAGNYTNPGWYYSTLSFYGDKRKIALGLTSYPLYTTLKTHLGVVLEADAIIDKDFRNMYGDKFMLNGGLRIQANEDFSTQFAYENNEQFVLTFEFQF